MDHVFDTDDGSPVEPLLSLFAGRMADEGAAPVRRIRSVRGARRVRPNRRTVRSSLDRTAIWVADRVIYTNELTCKTRRRRPRRDLSRDKLRPRSRVHRQQPRIADGIRRLDVHRSTTY